MHTNFTKHQNVEESGVDSNIENGGDQQVEKEREELLKGGVVKQRLQREENFSMHAGWMNSTRRSHDMWSTTSRTHVIRCCLQLSVIQQLEESEVRKHDSEVSQWKHIQSVRHSTTCAKRWSN